MSKSCTHTLTENGENAVAMNAKNTVEEFRGGG